MEDDIQIHIDKIYNPFMEPLEIYLPKFFCVFEHRVRKTKDLPTFSSDIWPITAVEVHGTSLFVYGLEGN